MKGYYNLSTPLSIFLLHTFCLGGWALGGTYETIVSCDYGPRPCTMPCFEVKTWFASSKATNHNFGNFTFIKALKPHLSFV